MADRIVISDARRYDGEYDFDLADESLTTLEWRWVKKISGYLPLTIGEGWVGGDPDLFLAFAVIAMRRAGKIGKEDALVAAEQLEDGATIRFVGDEVPDADPPQAPETGKSNGDSGEPSSPTSAPPGQTPSATGSHGSERSADSGLPTLVI